MMSCGSLLPPPWRRSCPRGGPEPGCHGCCLPQQRRLPLLGVSDSNILTAFNRAEETSAQSGERHWQNPNWIRGRAGRWHAVWPRAHRWAPRPRSSTAGLRCPPPPDTQYRCSGYHVGSLTFRSRLFPLLHSRELPGCPLRGPAWGGHGSWAAGPHSLRAVPFEPGGPRSSSVMCPLAGAAYEAHGKAVGASSSELGVLVPWRPPSPARSLPQGRLQGRQSWSPVFPVFSLGLAGDMGERSEKRVCVPWRHCQRVSVVTVPCLGAACPA